VTTGQLLEPLDVDLFQAAGRPGWDGLALAANARRVVTLTDGTVCQLVKADRHRRIIRVRYLPDWRGHIRARTLPVRALHKIGT
jgi:hypothetical protein